MDVITGNGRNGAYEIHPYIVEWEENEGGRLFVQSAKIELNAKNVDTKKIDEICGTPQTVSGSISIQVKEYNGKYFNDVTGYVNDQNYRIQRSY